MKKFMKKIGKSFWAMLALAVLLAACSAQRTEPAAGVTAPMITIYGKNYAAPYMPVDELPEAYTYIGELSAEHANDTGLEGCKMYAEMTKNSFTDFYLYQECGTPVDENTVNPEQRQWAYVQWVQTE